MTEAFDVSAALAHLQSLPVESLSEDAQSELNYLLWFFSHPDFLGHPISNPHRQLIG